MSLESVKKYLASAGADNKVIELEKSSATVELAAEALGCGPERIAKTLSFIIPSGPILIVAAGDARIDNKKFRDEFGVKPKMIPSQEVEGYIGHAPGGVCPFAVKDGVKTYLDISLKRFPLIYPAAGNAGSAVEMTPAELEKYSSSEKWTDVCKDWQE